MQFLILLQDLDLVSEIIGGDFNLIYKIQDLPFFDQTFVAVDQGFQTVKFSPEQGFKTSVQGTITGRDQRNDRFALFLRNFSLGRDITIDDEAAKLPVLLLKIIGDLQGQLGMDVIVQPLGGSSRQINQILEFVGQAVQQVCGSGHWVFFGLIIGHSKCRYT